VDVYIATDKGEKRNKTPLEESERPLVKADFEYNMKVTNIWSPWGWDSGALRHSRTDS